ncbi:MAG: (Fe-S)-binding protein [Promethearchaeota archaeon]
MSKIMRDTQVFNEQACTRCGDCFHLCPELKLSREDAISEIKALIMGENTKYVLQHCTTCFSCNLICPNDCKPYQLILENWNSLYKKRGAPPIYRFVCPSLKSNIWDMLTVLMSDEEKEWINKWMNQPEKETIFLVGNYTHILPFILGDTKLFEYFTPVDTLDHWEIGAYLYQGGYLDVVQEIGEKCLFDFSKWKTKTIVPFLDAVHHALTVMQPKEMGVKFDQNIIHFNEWLLTKISSGEIKLNEKLDLKVTVHDNCFSKTGESKYWDPPRRILELTGCKILEMKHIRKYSLCCGFGAGASWTKNIHIAFDIIKVSSEKFKEAEATGADALVTYCGGCLYLLWAAHEIFNSKIKIFHMIEIVRMAMGEEIDFSQKQHKERAWDIISVITYHLFLSLFSKPFYIEEIELDRDDFGSHKFIILKIIRWFLRFRFNRWVFRGMFKFLLPILSTPRKWVKKKKK